MSLRKACVKLSLIIFLVPLLSSCATVPSVQGRLRRLSAQGDFEHAAQLLSRFPSGFYGANNRLIEALDRGTIYHYAGRYQDSIKALEEAKRVHEELYTQSLSKIAASWLWNDAALPYPGEDFERAMVNVFQALNFIALEEYAAALVEARNASRILQSLNDRYPPGRQNIYTDDAFVRFLAGILYELPPDHSQVNDAFIAYRRAFELYNGPFKKHYAVGPPDLLKENLLSAAMWMGSREAESYQEKFRDTPVYSMDFRRQNAEVYIIYFRGQIINKVQSGIILPGMDGLLTRISFPRYRTGFRAPRSMFIRARDAQGREYPTALERVQDLDAIARKNLEDRRLRILAGAVARPVTKQLLVEALEDQVSDQAGTTAASFFRFAGNMYLLYSEQADLRSWETLPSEIYIGRLILPPGTYDLHGEDEHFLTLSLPAGSKKIIMQWLSF